MVQTKVVESEEPAASDEKSKKPKKNVKVSKESIKIKTPTIDKEMECIKQQDPVEEPKEPAEIKKEERKEGKAGNTTVQSIKEKRRAERLAKEKQAEEERERFVKEAAEKKAAEREEVTKQAKRLIFYRKPLCRRLNQALVVSECLRELDAQLKFRETIKNADREDEEAYVRWLREDVRKYEEEMKQKEEENFNKNRNYGIELKKQIEEIRTETKKKETEEFEAEKQDQINRDKYLLDAKNFEMQKLLDKKQRLNQFFKDAIEEKKQFNMKLQYEDAFEDRAIEVYNKARTSIQKLYKEMRLKENKERVRKASNAVEIIHDDIEERNYQKAVAEQEAQYQEKQKNRKEYELRLRKERQDTEIERVAAKSKFLQEEKDLKDWDMIQRFKRAEFNKETEMEERKQLWNKKMNYAKSLKKSMNEKEIAREQERIAEEKAQSLKEITEKENKKILDYSEEILNESKGIRPLFPILKAVQDCKKEMGLLPLKKHEEVEVAEKRKRKRRIARVCTKLVPEDKVCYLN